MAKIIGESVAETTSAGGGGETVEVSVSSLMPVGVSSEAGVFCVWMTPLQASATRRALDEWRYTIAASHADNKAALAVIGQIDARVSGK